MITLRKLHRNSSNLPNVALCPTLWLLLPQVLQDSFSWDTPRASGVCGRLEGGLLRACQTDSTHVEGAPKARDPRVTDEEGYLRQVATTPP